jgi:hypothetical protein
MAWPVGSSGILPVQLAAGAAFGDFRQIRESHQVDEVRNVTTRHVDVKKIAEVQMKGAQMRMLEMMV